MKRPAYAVAIVLSLALGGCAHTSFGSSTSVTVDDVWDMGNAQQVAQEHCDKYGKDALPQAAQFSWLDWTGKSMSFLCVHRR